MASGAPDISALAINPVRVRCRYERNPVEFQSPWGGTGQVLRRFGRWRLAMEWERLTASQADAIHTVFEAYGTELPFTIFNPERPLPTGAASPASMASLKVNGGNQTGKSLIVDGAPNSTLLFRQGDFIGLANTKQVFRVAANCTSNGAGQATISLAQYIGASPADNEDVIVSYVPFRVRLDADPDRAASGPSIQVNVSVEMSEWR